MTTRLICLLLSCSLVALEAHAAAPAPPGGNGLHSVSVQLVRPGDAPDGNATGSIRLRHKPTNPGKGKGANDERFELEVDKVDTDLDFELYVEDDEDPQDPGTKVFSYVADLHVDDAGENGSMEWDAWSKKGETLPLGVDGVSDLFGRCVQIRVGDDVYLRATLPDDTAPNGKTYKAISSLVRPDDPPDEDATGDVQLLSQPSTGHERFEVNAYDVNEDLEHRLFLEDPDDADVLVDIGKLSEVDGKKSKGGGDDDPQFKLKLDTMKGDELPLDVETNDDLLDRRVEIRSEGDVILKATLPGSWGGPPKNLMAEVTLKTPDPAPIDGAEGEVKMRQQPFKDRDLFDVTIRDVHDDDEYNLWVETGVDTGEFEKADVLVKCDDDDGGSKPSDDHLRYATDTSDGDALPFDADSTSDLFGLRVEVRSQGEVVLKGYVPDGFPTSKDNAKAKTKLETVDGAPSTNPRGRFRISSKPKKGDERFEVTVKKLDFGASTWQVFVAVVPGGDVYEKVGELTQLGKSSKGRLRLRTKDGDALPLDAATIHDLADLELEIRDDQGDAYLRATVPALDP